MNDSWDMATQAQNQPTETQKLKQTEADQDRWDDNDDGEDDKNNRNELDESNWLDEIKKSENQSSKKRSNANNSNTSLPNTSFLHGVQLPIGERELAPDDPNTTFFNEEDKKKEQTRGRGRGNREITQGRNTPAEEREPPKRDNRQKQDELEAPRRGNRQRQDEDQEQKEGGAPRRGNRSYREGQDQGAPRRGNRDTGVVGGDFKKKEYYQAREGQYERGNGGNRGYRGGYRGRGGNNYNSNYRGYNPRYTERNDNENQVQERGGYQQRQWGSRNYHQDREERNYGRYEGRNYDNRPQHYQNQQYRQSTRSSTSFIQPPAPEVPQPPAPQTTNTQTKHLHISETQKLVPKGRKCWPEMSLHILGCRVAVTARQLSDFRCKLLVMPYSTIQMEYYPGNVVNSSEVDYRKKIINKGSEIQDPGSVYLQKALSVYTFSAIAFVRVSRGSVQDSLKKGITEVLKLVEKIQKPITLQSLVFPICSELGDPTWVIHPFLSQLQNCRKIRQVWITTIQGSCYNKAVDAFNKHMETLFKSNEVFLN